MHDRIDLPLDAYMLQLEVIREAAAQHPHAEPAGGPAGASSSRRPVEEYVKAFNRMLGFDAALVSLVFVGTRADRAQAAMDEVLAQRQSQKSVQDELISLATQLAVTAQETSAVVEDERDGRDGRRADHRGDRAGPSRHQHGDRGRRRDGGGRRRWAA